MTLSETIYDLLYNSDRNPDNEAIALNLVADAPDGPERDSLLALFALEGIGEAENLEKCFNLVEKAIKEGCNPLAYYILGYMCEHALTPDQAEGGPRQQYDHYDAERFYELCAQQEGPWQIDALLWLAEFYSDFARGGDPEIALEYYEKVAELGDWRGANAIASYWESFYEARKDLPEEELKEMKEKIDYWQKKDDELYEEYLLTHPAEADPSIEED